MNKLNFSSLVKRLAENGKQAATFEVAEDFGTIRTSDVEFLGRRKNDQGGEYIQLQTEAGIFNIGLPVGTSKDCNAFAVKQMRAVRDFEVAGKNYEKGYVTFKAFGIVCEEEE